MKTIYAVLREKGGAWESCDVMSIWSTHKLAESEAARLCRKAKLEFWWNDGECGGEEFKIVEWRVNCIGDTINW